MQYVRDGINNSMDARSMNDKGMMIVNGVLCFMVLCLLGVTVFTDNKDAPFVMTGIAISQLVMSLYKYLWGDK